MGDVAKAIGASEKCSSSQYATFETKNGKIVTIRLANHNASTKRMDDAEREEEIAAATNREIEQEEGAEGGTTAPEPTTVPEMAGVDAPQGGVSATQQQQTAPTYESGSRFTLDLPNGSAVNGVVLQVTPDGVEVQTSSPVNGRFVQVFPTDEFDGMLSSVRDEADDVIWSREGAEPVEAEEENQNDAAANGQQIETKNEKPTLSDVIATLYEKGKEYATKLFNRSFFDVAQTPPHGCARLPFGHDRRLCPRPLPQNRRTLAA